MSADNSLELAAMLANLSKTIPCFKVNDLAKNTEEQCKFITDNNCLEEEATFDYVYLVYCELGYELRYAAISLIVCLVIVLFLNLSSVADEFLCPSLLAVAKNLRMSDSLAGVTLLAFGNGCPDIFASMAAASSGRPELIVGELLGAGIFCTSIVAGLIFIHSDFKLARRPMLRDATFYLLAVYLIWLYCWNQEITFCKSLAFIVIYVIYLIVALSGQALHSRLRGTYPIAEKQEQHIDSPEKHLDQAWFNWREESLRRRRRSSASKPSNDIRNSSEQQDARMTNSINIPRHHHHHHHYQVSQVGSLGDGAKSSSNADAQFGLEKPKEHTICSITDTCKQINCNLKNDAINGTDSKPAIKAIQCGVVEFDRQQADSRLKTVNCQKLIIDHQNSAEKHNDRKQQSGHLMVNNRELIGSHSTESEPIIEVDELTLDEWDDFLLRLSPINPTDWNETSILGKLIKILRAPLLFLTILTVPVVDNEQRNSNWCRLLNSLHCLTVPAIIILTRSWSSSSMSLVILGCPIKMLILLPFVGLALYVFKTTNAHEPPRYHAVFAYIGFIMSVLWIYCLATEIISLLKTFGIIFSLSDTAIGLGVLAWGNSLGDIVANLSLADAGYPRMALGASIGAPLLNLLLGFGLSFTISLKPDESSPVVYSPTITLLCSTLATILVCLMLSTLAPPNRSKKMFGYLLISGYVVYFALACCIEYGLLKF